MHARSIPSPNHRRMSVVDRLAQLDWVQILRLAVFSLYCVGLIVVK